MVHLYLNTNQATPFLSSRVDGTRDHTLGKGAQYINGTGEQLLCGPVVDDRSIECAYFYGEQVGIDSRVLSALILQIACVIVADVLMAT